MMIGCQREQLDWNNENVADEMQVSVVCLLKATRRVKKTAVWTRMKNRKK